MQAVKKGHYDPDRFLTIFGFDKKPFINHVVEGLPRKLDFVAEFLYGQTQLILDIHNAIFHELFKFVKGYVKKGQDDEALPIMVKGVEKWGTF